ncbi:MAG TPA: T9SS type A sorting domain-containing protein [Ignavibacteriaceae bacterium]|nr:T9SS type A sorting domain-containing protein [Ignavibacteriaceae bacterium]
MFYSGKTTAGWEKILNTGGRTLAFENVILVGTDSGCIRSLDYGKSWSFHIVDTIEVTIPFPQKTLLGIHRLCKNSKYIFAATSASIYSSGDTGKTWKAVGPFPEGNPLGMNNVFAIDSVVLATMFGGGLLRSTDNGNTWPQYIPGVKYFDYIVHNNVLFAGAQFEGIWYSEDLGFSWNICAGWPYFKFVTFLERNDKYFFADAWDELYRSDDYGLTWNVLTGMPPENYNLYEIYAVDSLIFASATDNKIYLSKNNGENWTDITEDADTTGIGESFCFSGNHLIMSKNNSLWSYDLSQITGLNTKNGTNFPGFKLFQNYPNPFNPSTNISFTIPSLEFVTLKIFNVLGAEVASIVNEEKIDGKYNVEFDGNNLSSGIYFYTIQAGNYKETKKLVIIK